MIRILYADITGVTSKQLYLYCYHPHKHTHNRGCDALRCEIYFTVWHALRITLSVAMETHWISSQTLLIANLSSCLQRLCLRCRYFYTLNQFFSPCLRDKVVVCWNLCVFRLFPPLFRVQHSWSFFRNIAATFFFLPKKETKIKVQINTLVSLKLQLCNVS